jgi:transposase, IS5 family
MPEGWDENPNRLQQRGLDARGVQKNGVNHYGYRNIICIDVEHGLFSRYAVPPANKHDSQMLSSSSILRTEMIMFGQIQPMQASALKTYWVLGALKVAFTKKAAATTRLAKQPKSVIEYISPCIEHVFGCITMSMDGKMPRKIGLERNKAWSGLKNLTFNFLRYLLRADRSSALAWSAIYLKPPEPFSVILMFNLLDLLAP